MADSTKEGDQHPTTNTSNTAENTNNTAENTNNTAENTNNTAENTNNTAENTNNTANNNTAENTANDAAPKVDDESGKTQGGDGNGTNEPAKSLEGEAQPQLSKKAMKRQMRQQAFQEKKRKRKEREKEQRKEKRQKKQADTEAWFNSLSPEEKERERERHRQIVKDRLQQREDTTKRLNQALIDGQRVVFDCSFDYLMNDKEAVSLNRQLQYSYNLNKSFNNPAQMHFTSVVGRTAALLDKLNGIETWKVHRHTEHFSEVFDKEKLVYLSADSPNVLHTPSKDDVYVIGAFVDRNRHKGITFSKAEELSLRTARLPLDEFVSLDGTQVLTVNHVFALLGHVGDGISWADAIVKVLPQRKNAKQLDDESEGEGDDGQESDVCSTGEDHGVGGGSGEE